MRRRLAALAVIALAAGVLSTFVAPALTWATVGGRAVRLGDVGFGLPPVGLLGAVAATVVVALAPRLWLASAALGFPAAVVGLYGALSLWRSVPTMGAVYYGADVVPGEALPALAAAHVVTLAGLCCSAAVARAAIINRDEARVGTRTTA